MNNIVRNITALLISIVFFTCVSHQQVLSESAAKQNEIADDEMSAWQIYSYGDLNELKLSKAKIPDILQASDVVIKIDASSVNPIDVFMTHGYGSSVLNILRKIRQYIGSTPQMDTEFPLIMGREFAGTVVSKGPRVNDLEIGDEVWGVIPGELQGCHATHAMVDSSYVYRRPKNLTSVEAASILFAGLTAWSALHYTGGVTHQPINNENKKILVLGGSGGVGIAAIQLLKAWNVPVVTTCSADAVDMVKKLGADVVVDYKKNDSDSRVISEGPYDIILDCANQGFEKAKLKGYPHSTYISLNSPLIENFDKYGLFVGGARNFGDFLWRIMSALKGQSFLRYGFFIPSPSGIKLIQELVETNKMVPVVHEVFPFHALPKAYERVEKGHLRGKIVVDMR